ncbi:TIGR01897 family CRISPR-associated protein [Candidatus Bathyarchaeota archaeon]|nr:TIGR01897 family CRISPR-associated protein [Candidatus Bathyarchaeota archaeon]
MKILVATWGLPWKNNKGNPLDPGWESSNDTMGWQKVTYKWKDKRMTCRTDLPLLASSIKPDQTLVIVLDTVTEIFRDTYTVLLKDVENLFQGFLKTIEEKTPFPFMNNLQILASPGTGTYNKAHFKGELLDFFYHLYYCLAIYLSSMPCEEIIELHLDLTHGVNFMPTLTYRALRDLGSLLAMTTKVSLSVYNSEPFTRERSPESVLEIHEVESVQLFPSPHFNMIEATNLRPLKAPSDLSRRHSNLLETWATEARFSRSLSQVRSKQVIDWINCFCSATMNGIPLAMLHFRIDTHGLKSYLEKLTNLYRDGITLSRANDEVEFILERQYSFTRQFLALVKTWIATVLLEKIIPPRIHGDQTYSLKDLFKLKNGLLKRDKKVEATVNLELNKLRFLKSKRLPHWIPYKDLMGHEEKSNREKMREKDLRNFNRNFLAHVGFESTAIELKTDENDLLIRYIKGEPVQNRIREALEKGITVTR